MLTKNFISLGKILLFSHLLVFGLQIQVKNKTLEEHYHRWLFKTKLGKMSQDISINGSEILKKTSNKAKKKAVHYVNDKLGDTAKDVNKVIKKKSKATQKNLKKKIEK